jgi:autotransporter-associated beta strand protein
MYPMNNFPARAIIRSVHEQALAMLPVLKLGAHCTKMVLCKRSLRSLRAPFQAVALALGLSNTLALADLITLTNGDNSSTSSYTGKGNWSNGQAPSAGNTYLVSGTNLVIRTPSSGSATFAGDSLTLANGAILAFKTAGPITTGSSPATGLFLDGGWLGLWVGKAATNSGYITLMSQGGCIDPQANSYLLLNSPIGGIGSLKLENYPNQSAVGGWLVLAASNSYTGGTIIDANMNLRVTNAGTLGDRAGSLTIINTNNAGYGQLDLAGTSQWIGSLSGTGGRIVNQNPNVPATLTIGNNDTGTSLYQGTILKGAGDLKIVKLGPAPLALLGLNTYAGGTVISNGALIMGGITNELAGPGTLILMQSDASTPQRIFGSNTFSGPIIVKAGWLQGAGVCSFGTNAITVDPNHALPSFYDTVAVNGPAILEPGYDLNSPAPLVIANGGQFKLHQNCAFTAVSINGTALAGTNLYADLAQRFPAVFSAGGSGAITVQPYGALPNLAPTITTPPADLARYPGASAVFSVVAASSPGMTNLYRWRKNGSLLSDGGNLIGSATAHLTINPVAAADDGAYDVLVGNALGTNTSQSAYLTVKPVTDGYGQALLTNRPVAFYRFEDPFNDGTTNAICDYIGDFNGISSNQVIRMDGAGDPSYPGLPNPNHAVNFAWGSANSSLQVSPWNLNTNTLTLAAWIYSTDVQQPFAELVFCRGEGTEAGLCYSESRMPDGRLALGYTWNGDFNTKYWNSRISPPLNQWALVALTITPTNASLYILTTNGCQTATHVYPHPAQPFTGATTIGSDSLGHDYHGFSGSVDDVAVFNHALSQSNLEDLLMAASGQARLAPTIQDQTASLTLNERQDATLSVAAAGSGLLTYRWQRFDGQGYADLADGGQFTGASTAALTISNLNPANATGYCVWITNSFGAVTSSIATLTINSASPAEAITLSAIEPQNQDWNTAEFWSDGLAATASAASKPGSSYHVQPGGALRTPRNYLAADFPGEVLYIEGDGRFNTDIATAAGALYLKGYNYGDIYFRKLVMKGGQLFNLEDSGFTAVLNGELNVVSNTPVYATSDTSTRTIIIRSQLTGDGCIEYHAYPGATFAADQSCLNIAGTDNTYTGTWNVVLGSLLGSQPGALGTNSITVASSGALQTIYDIYSPNATLTLNGQMFLNQNDTFASVSVAGTSLQPGKYSFSQLHAAFPANFPTTWTMLRDMWINTGSGSLTVLGTGPVTLVPTFKGNSLTLTWNGAGKLLMADSPAGPWTTNTTATSPFTVDLTAPKKFFRIQVQ